jgi:hypothetical protein
MARNDLGDRQGLAIMTVVDFGDGLVIDHDWLASSLFAERQ